MATTSSFKDIIDVPIWRTLASNFSATAAGSCICYDHRNNEDRDPYIYCLINATTFMRYSAKNDEWQTLTSPALAGTFAAGAFCEFVASAGPNGLLSGSNTTSVINISSSTTLNGPVAINQLANRGDGVGYKIRIIGKGPSSGSGLTQESYIVANTSGSSPTIYVSPPFTFIPVNGDRYEILSGQVIVSSAGTLATNFVKRYDLATNTFMTVTQTNMPPILSTDASTVMLDELYVPSTMSPSGGFLGNIVATSCSTTTIAGQTSGGDNSVLTNEYRNFQIRIVQDTSATSASVGQRKTIVSHTSGSAGTASIYTISGSWTTTPAATCTFVIENNNDLLLWNSGSTTTWAYRPGGFTADGAWCAGTAATTYSAGPLPYASRGSAMGAGCSSFGSYGIALDTSKATRYSYIYSFRGNNGNSLDVLDVAGAAWVGSWANGIFYGGQTGATNFTTGTCGAYDPVTNGGRYGYMNVNGTQRFARFDVRNRTLEPWCYLQYPASASLVGGKIATVPFIDGTVKLTTVYHLLDTSTLLYGCLATR